MNRNIHFTMTILSELCKALHKNMYHSDVLIRVLKCKV